MRTSALSLFLGLALLGASAISLPAAVVHEPDWMLLVGPYPQPGTPTAQAELAIMIWLQRARTHADVARVLAEATPSLGCFNDALKAAPTLSLSDYPMTVALLDQARADLEPILAGLQAAFARPRPYQSFAALTPAIPMEAGPSYPCPHAALGAVYAQIISQFVPDSRDALQAIGAQLGNDRVTAGVQWPSDVEAGQRLGRVFATFWISQPEHRQLIVDCCGAEWRKR